MTAKSAHQKDGQRRSTTQAEEQPPAPKKRRAKSWHSTSRLSRADCIKVGAAGGCDFSCVVKYLEGGRITTHSKARVEDGLRKTGLERLIAKETNGVHAHTAHAHYPSPSSPPPSSN